MKHTELLPDDPKLTAYALGELSGDERAAVEAALRDDPTLRAIVDDVRATALQVEAALAAEAGGNTSPSRPPTPVTPRATPTKKINGHAVLVPITPGSKRGDGKAESPVEGYPARRGGKLIRFPQFYYIVSGVAAACFAVMVALYRDAHEAKEQARIAQQRQRAAEQMRTQPAVIVFGDSLSLPSDAARRPAPTETVGARIVATETPASNSGPAAEQATAPLPSRPAFIEQSLSLGDSAGSKAAAAASGQDRVVFATPPPAEPVPVVASTETVHASTPVSLAATPAAATAAISAEASTAQRKTDIAAAPTVAGSSLQRSFAPTSEVVVLSPFTVSADREGMAGAITSMTRTNVREMPAREETPSAPRAAPFDSNTEAYAYTQDNDFLGAESNPLSTFSVDVDTASYANVRRIIEYGKLPPRDAVRVEELLNYFPYSYAAPAGKGDTTPFAASLEVADAPWAPQHRLVRIGLKAREVPTAERAAANLVFLIDVSGSMNMPNKLPLVKESMRLLLTKLRPDDRVAIVTYAGQSGLALPSTPVAQSREIFDALEALTPGGSTNGAMGIQLAYDIAKANFVKAGINRVILCTDGDFNVGVTSEGDLVRLIEDKARSGVFLTVLGFGMGNYKDATLEKLADKGNGNYGYIDTRREAQKLLVEQVSSTLVTVAKDVKVQVEFNPAKVSRYRLIGYENRVLKKEDFNNDNVDAGEIGAGHSVTALYEIVPVGADEKFAKATPPVDELKYQARGAVSSRLETPMPAKKQAAAHDELLTVKVRFKKPDAFFSEKREFALKDDGRQFAKASADFRFAAAVAQFGMILRGSPHKGSATIGDVIAWAATASATPADDPGGYRGEFIDLARKAARMVH